MLLGVGYSQCDANGDGDLDVLDVVIEVDCILTDCWEGGSDTTDVCVDIDGNVYETVLIGEQLWMAENLKVTKYRDGSAIPTGYSGFPWAELETGAYAVYDDDPSNAEVYGNLYNWYAVDDDRGVCPDGWHVPTDEEWIELEMFLGMSWEEAIGTGLDRGTDEGSKLAGNSDLWSDGNLVNNSEFGTSGFNGLPTGYRNNNSGYYDYMGDYGYFWSSSEMYSYYAWYRLLNYSSSNVNRYYLGKQGGFSIRCLGD